MPDEKKLTAWDLARTLQEAAKLCEGLPRMLGEEFKQTAEQGTDEIAGRLKTSMEALKHFETVIDGKRDEMCAHIDKLWTDFRKRHADIAQKIKALPKIEPRYNLASELKSLLEVADRVARLTPVQMERLVELAKALQGN